MDSEASGIEPDMHVIDTKEFLSFIADEFSWGDLAGETVMDIGCASGKNSTKCIISNFPAFERIIAVDIISTLIRLAVHLNRDSKVEYHVANIEDSSTLRRWIAKVSKVVSVYCFSFLIDQKSAFRNVYRLLKPGGQAAILFSLTSRCFDVFDDIKENSKWKIFFQKIHNVVPESHTKKLGAPHYRQMFEDIGFEVLMCEEKDRLQSYASDEVCKKIVTVCPLIEMFPLELREEFNDFVYESFLKHSPRNDDGKPCLRYRTLSVLLKKPE